MPTSEPSSRPNGQWDAVVVGAGPAGSSAAFHLASRGRRVLLIERRAFPRDKSCGDGLTPLAVRLLDELGVLSRLRAPTRIAGVRMFMRNRGQRDFLYPQRPDIPDYGLVVPRHELDAEICRAAVRAGATLWEETAVTGLVRDGDRTIGAHARMRDGSMVDVLGAVVVAADGAVSRFANSSTAADRTARAASNKELGFALRGYFRGITGLGDRLEIYLPLTDATDRYVLPSYGWVFPTGTDTANLGVGLFRRDEEDDVGQLYRRFVKELIERDPRFAQAEPVGTPLGAPLRFDFSPERCSAPGLLLVGDAAGLISPFTGEGITYALESGKLAAQTIDRCLKASLRDPPIEQDYRAVLEDRYSGYFEAGQRSARRYQLVWHIVESTFQSDRPIFGLLRRAVLMPEGVGGSVEEHLMDDVSGLLPRYGLRVGEDLVEVGSRLLQTVRQDWPFFGRMSIARHARGSLTFRPALFLLLASHFGDPKRPGLIDLAAAVELGYLAGLAQSGIDEPADASSNGELNWGNRFCLLFGDYLLSKSFELASGMNTAAARLANSLTGICTGQLHDAASAYRQNLPIDERLGIMTARCAALIELPCALGGEWSGATAAHVETLTRYGRHVGLAYALTEDALFLKSPEGGDASVTASDIGRGRYSLPILLAMQRGHGDRIRELLRQPDRRAIEQVRVIADELGTVEHTQRLALEEVTLAQTALASLPDCPAKTALNHLAAFAANREAPRSRSDLRGTLDTL